MTRPYRPSNGTEGIIFGTKFCNKCKHDNYTDENPEGGCQILLMTMCFRVDEEGYPKEWVTDDAEGPRCTAFELEE